MIITCERCDTQYYLASALVKKTGSKVRCSKCHYEFIAFPPAGDEADVSSPPVTSGADDTDQQAPVAEEERQPETTFPDSGQDAGDLSGETFGADEIDFSEAPAEGVGDDAEMSKLADELDKIFGTDEPEDKGVAMETGDTSEDTAPDRYSGEIETLDLSTLDDELDQLLDDDHRGKSETEADGLEDAETIDLSELEDETDRITQPETFEKDKMASATGTEIIEEISLDDRDEGHDDKKDEDAAKHKLSSGAMEAGAGLALETLLTGDSDSETDDIIKSEFFAGDDRGDDLGEEIPPKDGDVGLDTIQIDGFEAELDRLDDIKPEENDVTDDFDIETIPTGENNKTEPPEQQISDERNERSVESSGVIPESPDERQSSGEEARSVELSEQEDLGLDNREIESLDLDLENLGDWAMATDENLSEEPSEPGEDLGLDTREIESLDLDLEILGDQAAAGDENQPKEFSEQKEDLGLDIREIESLDLDLESLDEGTAPVGGDRSLESSRAAEDVAQDVEQAGRIDLDLETLEELTLDEDGIQPKDPLESDGNFVLDTNQIESLDLDLEPLDESARTDDLQDEEIILDTDQIKPLNIEVDSSDGLQEPAEPVAEEAPAEKKLMATDNITLSTDSKKTAEVLNLNLERPDLDGESDPDEGIDLPVLDDLLAPAEVIDETLMDNSFDRKDDSKLEVQEEATEPVEEMPAEDSQPILELENIGKEVDRSEKDKAPEEVQPATKAKPDVQSRVPTETKEKAQPVDVPLSDKASAQPERFEMLPRQRSGKWLLVLLAIVLLLALLFGMNAMGVKVPFIGDLNIPFISGFGQPAADDPGNARIKTIGINSRFVTNKKSGQLLVITGKVLNQYDNTRGFVQIKGNVYAGGGNLVATQSVYCGNILSDTDLTAKPFKDIQRYLNNKLGAGGTGTLKVGSGKTLPFMIVFSDLPPNIEEFSVEVIGSAAL